MDNLHYIIEPINDNYDTEGHVVYHQTNHASFQNIMFKDTNENLETAINIAQIKTGKKFACFLIKVFN